MASFEMDIKTEGDEIRLSLRGKLDEDASLQLDSVPMGKVLTVDLAGLASINSCGIRDWINWTKKFPGDTSFTFLNCPQPFMDQVNMVSGFLPEGSTIDSFFLPYFCETCDEGRGLLLSREKDYPQGSPEVKEEIPCETCGNTAELDILPQKYLRFIQS